MRKIIAVTSTLLLISICIFSVTSVFADVPSVINLTPFGEGENTIVDIEITHGSPSSTHYIDIIEVKYKEKTRNVVIDLLDVIDDLDPQTSTTFTYQHDLGTGEYLSAEVRAQCTDHGWSSWENVEIDIETETSFIDNLGTIPIVAVIIIIIIAVLIVILRRR